MDTAQNLTVLNSREDLNFLSGYNRIYRDSEFNDDPYFGVNVSCEYYNVSTLSQFANGPLFLSINIQSLMSKHEQLVEYIHELESANLSVDVIAVQEIWDVRYPELVNLPGFKPLIFKKRRDMRGGGEGFFI
jgi:hypothetical protein